MRGLSAVELSDAKSILAVIARVKKEIADKPGWEIIDNVYLNVLSFTNYLMWHDVRYNIDKFKESPLIRSMISNSVDAGLKTKPRPTPQTRTKRTSGRTECCCR